LFGFAITAIMAAVNVEESLIIFLGKVDLPRIHPVEVLEDVVKFLNGQGLSESWHLTGLTTSAFKKELFPDVFMIGASLEMLFCVCSLQCWFLAGFVTRALRMANVVPQTQQSEAVSASVDVSQDESARWVLRCAVWAHYHLHVVKGLGQFGPKFSP